MTRPNEAVYVADGMPAVYDEMLMPLFIQGYVIVMEEEKVSVRTQMSTHLKDLMSDSQLYGWVKTQAFHAMWLNQLSQGRATWEDQEVKLSFC